MLLTESRRQQHSTTTQPPLCVDLDGTLIAGDLLYESATALIRRNFFYLFLLPLWLLKGKAHLKEQIAARVQLDVESLPYRQELLDFLREEKKDGRCLVLATATHIRLAGAVADHLNLFDEVIATDHGGNLKGQAKLRELEQRFDVTGFDYIGDSKADLPIWKKARRSYLVQPSRGVMRQAASMGAPARVFQEDQSKLKAAVKLLRPHQWSKNALLFVPLVLAHQIGNLPLLGLAALAFVAFSLCASSVYILNDLLDLQADRQHPRKKRRPLAAGALSVPAGVVLMFATLCAGLAVSLVFHPWPFAGILLAYLATTTAYSFYLKRQPMVDVFTLAGLYTVRILAGGLAVNIPVTGWLIAFSLFFFISLALVKRYAELARAALEDCETLDHRGYHIEDIGLIQSIGPASGYMAVLTMCLYINASNVLRLYTSPHLLWIISFILFFWITRVWFLARRRQLDEDPVIFATTDPFSYLAGTAVVAVLIFAA